MVVLYENIWHILLMLVFLGASAFFSLAETAFFNLSRRQVTSLQESAHRIQRLAALLLSKPNRLLGSLLFGNMAVNVCFYSFASILTVDIGRHLGPTMAVISAILTLVILVIFGEILPKSLGYLNSVRLAVSTALPCFFCVKALAPVHAIFNFLLVEPAIRLLLGSARKPKPVTINQLKILIESSKRAGLISPDENRLISQVLEFAFLKVRQAMQPRVDMVACDINSPPLHAKNLMLENNLNKLPVYESDIDAIVGLVHLKDILLRSNESLNKLVTDIYFVPEQKSVESLLEFFRHTQIDTAVVVDEYGGIAGIISSENIIEELLGPSKPPHGLKPVKQIGPMKYRLAGDIAVHDWADAFAIEVPDNRLSTIGGLVTALLGKIPQPGDVAYLENLKFTVEQTRRHRIETVILSLETAKSDGQITDKI